MANFGRAFSYLIAAQFQAVALLFFAWWAGQWLNEHYAKSFNWYAVTIPLAVIGMAQTLYVVVRQVMKEGKSDDAAKADREGREKRGRQAPPSGS